MPHGFWRPGILLRSFLHPLALSLTLPLFLIPAPGHSQQVEKAKRFLLWTMALCFLIGMGGEPELALSAPTPQEEFQLALEYLSQQARSIATVRVKYLWVQWLPPEEAKKSGFPDQITKSTCTYLKSGEKFRYEDDLRFGDETKIAYQWITVYDGQYNKTYNPLTKQGSISQTKTPPLEFFSLAYFVPKGNIAEFLSTYAKNITPSFINDGRGNRLLLLKFTEKNVSHEISLDPNAGYQPRTVYRRGTVPKEAALITGIVVGETRLEISEYKQVGRFFLPARARLTYDCHLSDGTVKQATWRTVELLEIRVNEPVEEKEFTLDFPPGTRVTEYDLQINYVIP